MHGQLKPSGPSLSDLVCGHKQPLTVMRTGVVELSLLGVGSVLNEPVL
jgi:hypothetical protein